MMEIMSRATDVTPTLTSVPLRFPVAEPNRSPDALEPSTQTMTPTVEAPERSRSNSSTGASIHQYGSPTSLPFHILPNTSCAEPNSDGRAAAQRLPSSVEYSELQMLSSKVLADITTDDKIYNESQKVTPEDTCADVPSPNLFTKVTQPAPDHNATIDWTRTLQQYMTMANDGATFVKPCTENLEGCRATSFDAMDQLAKFQTMLANMSHLLVPPHLLPVSSRQTPRDVVPQMLSSNLLLDPAHFVNSTASAVPHCDTYKAATYSLPTFTTPNSSRHGTRTPPSQTSFLPSLNELQQSPTQMAFTASLLAAMATQKPVEFPDPFATAEGHFLPTRVQMSHNTSSTTTPANFPPLNSHQAGSFMEQTLGKMPGFNLPDNRDLLYELGKRLMAMAATPTLAEAAANQPNLNVLPSTEARTVPNAAFLGEGYNVSSESSLFPNPMLAMMNAALFPGANANQLNVHSSSHSAFPNGCSLPTVSDKKPMTNFTCDRNIHSLSTGGSTGLSGISMRGNQKYSAYYQHQRKQSLQHSNPNEFGTANSVRRQSSATSVPLASTRCGTRRFRSGLTNTSVTTNGQEARMVQPPPGLRGHGGTTGGSLFSHLRGTPFKHSSTSTSFGASPGLSKSQITSDVLTNSSILPSSGPTETTHTTHRLRDTAFLCSCGKDFESLYVFTVHMKDTGHKPKSDQSERDIPKLVRGQDMWINSETEQTREILRCMRCHQSFRNLPELTMHMMKTNHYSEIVYNDSGRLVFVNPEEHRRGSVQTTTASAASMVSSSGRQTTVLSGQHSGRRNLKANMNATTTVSSWSTPLGDTQDRARDADDQVPDKQQGAVIRPERTCVPSNVDGKQLNMNVDQVEMRRGEGSNEQLNELCNYQDFESDKPMEAHPQEAGKNHKYIERAPTKSPRTEKLDHMGCADSSTDPDDGAVGGSVIRQIESFVENNLPRESCDLLRAKIDDCHTDILHSLSPLSTVAESGVINSGANDSSTHSPGSSRKRTYSEASLSQQSSPLPSPSNESEGKSRKVHLTKTDRPSSASSTSPVKVTSTNELSQCLTENPLSSLQKLVDTTHKPIPPSSAFSTSGSSNLFVTCNPTSSSSRHSLLGRSSGGVSSCSNRVSYSPISKQSTNISNGPFTPTGSAAPHLFPPINKHDNLPPALSALYAYVERSSLNQPSQVSSNEDLHQQNFTTQNEASDFATQFAGLNANATSINPILQAFYMAAMSSIAAQYLRPVTTNPVNTQPQEDPLHLFRQATQNFREAFEISLQTSSPPKSDLTNEWFKMLHMFGMHAGKHDSSEQTSPSEGSEQSDTNYSVKRFGSPLQQLMSARKASGSEHGDCEFISHDASQSTSQGDVTQSHFGSPYTHSPTLATAGPASSSPPSNKSVSGTFHSTLSNVQSGRCQSTLSARSITNGNAPTSLISTMITKKAKCHFCGKPFANKGQVRLHISKNKCPCLLQQSCHAIALAAAFGSDRHHTQSSSASAAKSAYTTLANPTVGLRNMKTNKNTEFSCTPRTLQPEDTSVVPSAFSLLKERFQNFDLVPQLTARSSSQQSMDSTKPNGAFSAFTTVSSTATDSALPLSNLTFPSMTQSPEQWLGTSTPFSSPSMTKDSGLNHPANVSVATATAAANASHLAAMALLAQTLVQLTSIQVTRPPSDGNMEEEAHSTSPHKLTPFRSGILSHPSDIMSGLPFVNPGGVNMDLLINQANIAKQLTGISWKDPSLSVGTHKDTSGLDVVDGYRAELAPNSLP